SCGTTTRTKTEWRDWKAAIAQQRSGGGAKCTICVFFFSSRRRHTRLQGDWSSDVCSSDLNQPEQQASYNQEQKQHKWFEGGFGRSEERRVGKECRYRWSPYYEKKKMMNAGRITQYTANMIDPSVLLQFSIAIAIS